MTIRKTKEKLVNCEGCRKHLSEKTSHFESETHILNQQSVQHSNKLNQQSTQKRILPLAQEVGIIVSGKTYIKLKIKPTDNPEHHIDELSG